MSKPFSGYTLAELRWRPAEQIVEALPCEALYRITRKDKRYWQEVKRGMRPEDDEIQAIRMWLDRQSEDVG